MSFERGNESVSTWLRFYFAIRSLNRSFRQILLVSIPLVAIAMWVSFAFLLFFYLNGHAPEFTEKPSFFSYLIFTLRFALPAILSILIGVYFLLNRAHEYIFTLYQPLPETKLEIKQRIWHRLWGWHGLLLFQNYMVVNSTNLEPSNHWSLWLGGPAFLIIYDGFAVYLERGNRFSRIVGAFPITYLDARETIKGIVDLRPHTRCGKVTAWSKDGIRIEFKICVEFQIEPGLPTHNANEKLLYPFNPLAVRKAVEYTAVGAHDGKLQEVDWCEGAMGRVKGIIGRHVCSRRIDELFLKNGGGGQMLSPTVTTELMEKINTRLVKDAGTRMLSLQITDITIPLGVRRQRLDVWEAEKDSLITRVRGESQAYEIRTNEAAVAKGQRDLIVAIAKNLKRIDPSHFPEPLLLSVSGILDQGLRDPLVQTYMAKGTLDSLKKIQDLL